MTTLRFTPFQPLNLSIPTFAHVAMEVLRRHTLAFLQLCCALFYRAEYAGAPEFSFSSRVLEFGSFRRKRPLSVRGAQFVYLLHRPLSNGSLIFRLVQCT